MVRSQGRRNAFRGSAEGCFLLGKAGRMLAALASLWIGIEGGNAQTWPPSARPGLWDFLDGFPQYDPFAFGISAATYDNNGDLVAGGTMQGGANAGARLQRWSGNRWMPLGDRLVNEAGGTGVAEILAIAVAPGGDIFIGGTFTRAYNADGSSVVSSGIVRWDPGVGSFKSLGQGVGGFGTLTVRSIAIGGGGALYVGGLFQVGINGDGSTISLFNVGQWDEAGGTWKGLGDGLSSTVNALSLESGGDLIAGGWFQNSGGSIQLNHVARWNGNQWSAVGGGINTIVEAAEVDPSDNIYVSPGDYVKGGLLRWNHTSARWDTLPGGENFDHPIWLEIDDNGNAYLAYARGAPTYAREVAMWSGGVKTLLASFSGAGTPLTLAVDRQAAGLRLFMGGAYTAFFDPLNGVQRDLENSAVWNATSWLQLAANLPANSAIYAVTPFQRFVGGEFSFLDKDAKQGSNIASYDHQNRLWRRVGGGTNGAVHALAEFDNGAGLGVVVGGAFTIAYDNDDKPSSLSNIALWNRTGFGGWESLGQGVDDTVDALEIVGSFADTAYVYVGGKFSKGVNFDGSEVHSPCILRWNTASERWEPLGSGLSGGSPSRVRSIAAVRPALSTGATIYVGGNFVLPLAGPGSNDTATNIVEWNGSTDTWSALGRGLNGEVLALRHTGSSESAEDLVWAGGEFTVAINEYNLGLSTKYIAAWNRGLRRWEQVGHGVNGPVRAIAGNAYPIVGGDFDALEDADGAAYYSNHIALYAPWPIYPVTKAGWNRFGIGAPLPVHALAFAAPCDQYSGEIAAVGMKVSPQGGYNGGIVAEWKYIYTPQAGSFILVGSANTGPSCAPGKCASVIDVSHHTCSAPYGLPLSSRDIGPTGALHFGEFLPLENLPLNSPITMTVQDSGGPPVGVFEVVRNSESPYAFILGGLVDSASFAPNPNGRPTRLSIRSYPLTLDSLEDRGVALLCVHAATDAPMIDLLSESEGAVAESLLYGDGAPGHRLSPSFQTFYVRKTQTGEPLDTFMVDLSQKSGSAVVLTLAGFLNPSANRDGPPLTLLLTDPGISLTTFVDPGARMASGPRRYALEQNYPNPFNPETRIRFEIPEVTDVHLAVYDLLGREVAVLADGRRASGVYEVRFSAGRLASGVYLYRLRAGSYTETRKLLVLR